MEQIRFSKPTVPGRSDNADILAEAEVLFGDDSLFAGMRLTGITIRKSRRPEDKVFVTFPAQGVGAGTERRYFDYLRPVASLRTREGQDLMWKLRKRISQEYLLWAEKEAQ